MNRFTELKDNEVALLRAEHSTGIVLDEMFNRAVKDNQNVYTVFKSEKEAVAAARKMLLDKDNIEIVIYGSKEECLHYLT